MQNILQDQVCFCLVERCYVACDGINFTHCLKLKTVRSRKWSEHVTLLRIEALR